MTYVRLEGQIVYIRTCNLTDLVLGEMHFLGWARAAAGCSATMQTQTLSQSTWLHRLRRKERCWMIESEEKLISWSLKTSSLNVTWIWNVSYLCNQKSTLILWGLYKWKFALLPGSRQRLETKGTSMKKSLSSNTWTWLESGWVQWTSWPSLKILASTSHSERCY